VVALVEFKTPLLTMDFPADLVAVALFPVQEAQEVQEHLGREIAGGPELLLQIMAAAVAEVQIALRALVETEQRR
jgi:hypothetical protein